MNTNIDVKYDSNTWTVRIQREDEQVIVLQASLSANLWYQAVLAGVVADEAVTINREISLIRQGGPK